jgi:RNA polymerase II subunit A small phosphatase-like protein
MFVSQFEIKKLINLLDNRENKALDDGLEDLFDEMDRVRRDLSRLNGDVERLPYEDSLRAWGLLDAIQQEPDPLVGEGDERKFAKVLKVAMDAAPANALLGRGEYEDVFPFLNNLLGRLQEDEPRQEVEKTGDEIEFGLVKQEIAQARALAAQHLYDRALQNLAGLTARFRSEAALAEIKIAQDDIVKERKLEISKREKLAIQLEKDNPEDFPAQEQAWKVVQELDSENPRAEKVLLELGKKKNQVDMVNELRELAPDLDSALRRKDLKKLNELREHYERMTFLLQETPYAKESALAQEAFSKQINMLRDELGIAATWQTQGELGLVYRKIREQYEKGIPAVEIYEYRETADGKKTLMQKPTLMATSAALEYIAREYMDFLKSKIHEYIDRLSNYKNEPRTILLKIGEIREFVDDAGLISTHRMMLTAEERELQGIEKESMEYTANYDQALELFIQAQDQSIPLIDRHKLLLQTKRLFPALNGLQDEIHNNEQQQVDRKINHVRAELARAWHLALENNHTEARKALEEQRSQVEEIGGEVFQEYLRYGEKIILRQQEKEHRMEEDEKADQSILVRKEIKTVNAVTSQGAGERQKDDKILLVLDIDESLISSSDNPLSPDFHFEFFGYKVTKRPHLDNFLTQVFQWFDVAIWTGATEEYTKYILPQIMPDPSLLKFVWTRYRCISALDYENNDFFWIKDIIKLERRGYKKEKILFIEDDLRVVQRSYGNLIQISPFSGNADDKELSELLKFLSKLRHVDNVRTIDKLNWLSQPDTKGE